MNTQKIEDVEGDALKVAMGNVDRHLDNSPSSTAPIKSEMDYRPPAARIAMAPSSTSHARSVKESDEKAFLVVDKSLEQLKKSRLEIMADVKKKMAELASLNHEIMVSENILLSRQFAADMLEVSLPFSQEEKAK